MPNDRPTDSRVSGDAPVVVWFRDDLRLGDNPALTAALRTERPVLALFVFEEGGDGPRPIGSATRWWLHHSLAELGADIEKRGGRLVLRRGPARDVVPAVIGEAGAAEIHWNRRYEGGAIATDKALREALLAEGIAVHSHNGNLIAEPWTVQKGDGGWFKVFTPFWRALRQTVGTPRDPYPAPRKIKGFEGALASDDLDAWGLLPTKPDWAGGLRETWEPGEAGARRRLAGFLDDGIARYKAERDQPAAGASSMLSPHLRFGEISPVSIWHAATARSGHDAATEKFLSEIGWREFSYNLLFHFPDLATRNFQSRFDEFPWTKGGEDDIAAWQRGRTGVPIVDAGMRQLWQTGVMHNRIRMVAASYLVKHLLADWRIGEAWFWDTLVDADIANNPASWQWVAGSGADAAPYFRVFNPVLQGRKFDADGAYVRRFVPELAGLPDRFIHAPWEAPADVLKAAGVQLGRDYPHPIVPLDEGRDRALRAFEALRDAA
ncbi:cryptochrome/photolyase family protein [Methylobrevis albus]|uniref:Deoxyribodipyrimidine photo-lyase n=1 Tax=Methylobrevis albus TaxID=2793297 RepID=A0A931MXX5_9HYPH|nr:deoxyribodipyrimidine photo-lyase [Methylobrevis albus]MBH0239753.1 deoxyribodipyrimidine photo-lyase [Methylobrevis albus]